MPFRSPFLVATLGIAIPFVGQTASPVEGNWNGVLHTGGPDLRLALHITAHDGTLQATLDSLDQGAMGIPCGPVAFAAQKLTVDVPAVHGTYTATLSADGQTLRGEWMQGLPLPLDLSRTAVAHAQSPQASPAQPPVPASKLSSILTQDMQPLVKANPQMGVAIGVLDHGKPYVIAIGSAQADSIFEIGSITKTFTALALAQMVEQKKVTLDEPVRALLPPDANAKAGPNEITLLDLATQHSGLSRLPPNMHPVSMLDPYADYGAPQLLEAMHTLGYGKPQPAPYGYSNFGFGLLGFALANRAHMPYEQLVQDEITTPLGMADTSITLTPAQQKRFIAGYQATWKPAQAWHLNALSGAGALHSTASDLLTYAEAMLHPEHLPGTLPQAVALVQKPQADVAPHVRIGLAWMTRDQNGYIWHNGGTGGYSSLLLLDPRHDRAITVLSNREDSTPGQAELVNRIAAHIFALLNGKPVPPL